MANRSIYKKELVEVGCIYDLQTSYLKKLKKVWGEVDLVVGGPPCQGFSGIGHRRTYSIDKKDIPSNHLYEEMIRVIRALKPKVFLFENVQGLLNSKWSEGSKKVKIWPILLNAFASLPEYTVRPTTVHAYDYGVPQNRPRVLLVGIRDDSLPFSKTTYADDAIRAGFLWEDS